MHKSDGSYFSFAHTSVKLREQFTFGTTFDLAEFTSCTVKAVILILIL